MRTGKEMNKVCRLQSAKRAYTENVEQMRRESRETYIKSSEAI